MFSGKHMRINMQESLKALVAIGLLLLYGIGNIPVEVVHQFVHAHSTAVAHTVKAEHDPCHIRLYHGERAGRCDHQKHLVKLEKCSLCHAIVHKDHVVLSSFAFSFNPSYSFVSGSVIAILPYPNYLALSSRGPPATFF